MRAIFIILVSLWPFMQLWAQPGAPKVEDMRTRQLIKTGAKYFEKKAYKKAYPYLREASFRRKRKKIVHYQLGISALEARDYNTALKSLELVKDKAARFPNADFYYAEALKANGSYDKALEYFEDYVKARKTNPTDISTNPMVRKAEQHARACAEAMQAKSGSTDYYLKNVNDNFNTAAQERSLTTKSKSGIRLLEVSDERGTRIVRVEDGEIFEMPGSVGNPALNSGSPYIAPDSTTVFFTRIEETPDGVHQESKIYIGRLTKEGTIVDIRRLGSGVNRDGFSSKNPTLSVTEHGQQILYFSSTLPGGQGGYDLWYAIRMANGEFTRAYNLGVRINGAANEITPFYYQQGGKLYFSSDKPSGYGGYDVYEINGEKHRWKGNAPAHVQMPINSSADDYHFIMEQDGRGTVTSNRAEGTTDEKGVPTDNIYRFSLKKYGQPKRS